MWRFVRNVAACLVGILLGGGVNMAIVVLGPMFIPPPIGVDVSDADSLRLSIHLFEPRHFVAPFLAHALGTLLGSLAAYLIAARNRAAMAYVVGVFFLAGGVVASFIIPAPVWFIALDLVVAYIPMAWLAVHLGRRVAVRLGRAG